MAHNATEGSHSHAMSGTEGAFLEAPCHGHVHYPRPSTEWALQGLRPIISRLIQCGVGRIRQHHHFGAADSSGVGFHCRRAVFSSIHCQVQLLVGRQAVHLRRVSGKEQFPK